MSERPVILLEPPLFDCRAPHLGCAILIAALRRAGYRALFRDLNVEAVMWLLAPERLSGAARRVKARPGSGPRYLRAAGCADRLPAATRQALADLRHPQRFFDSRVHRAARSTIDAALDVQALAVHEQLYASLCPQQYNGPYRAGSLRDLLAATVDRESNLFLPFFEECAVPEVMESNPLLVGVSISNVFQVIPGLTLARRLRAEGVYVAVGGPLFSKFRAEIATRPEFFDLCSAVAIGEGEETLPALAAAIERGVAPAAVANLLYREGSRVVSTPVRPPGGLVEVGAADFRDLDLSGYLTPSPVLPIHAGKGCGWRRCTFCEIPQSDGESSAARRIREPHRVVEEMRTQQERHGARHFVFTDESLEPGLLRGMAETIEESRLDVNYLGYARLSDEFTPQLCTALARSGCRKLLFGLESGSQEVNDQCRKGVDLGVARRAIDACQQAGIAVHVFSIVGLPGERGQAAEDAGGYLSGLARQLDVPLSTMDVAPFYLNWNSWLRRNAAGCGISFRASQDFPLHADEYWMADGMDSGAALAAADEMHRRVCWEASALGLDIGYRNPVWPGWEEYTLLYLSQGAAFRDAARQAWPVATGDLLERSVLVVEDLAAGASEAGRLLAWSPSAPAVETTEEVYRAISARREFKVGELAGELCGGRSADAQWESLAQIAALIHAGVLQW